MVERRILIDDYGLLIFEQRFIIVYFLDYDMSAIKIYFLYVGCIFIYYLLFIFFILFKNILFFIINIYIWSNYRK